MSNLQGKLCAYPNNTQELFYNHHSEGKGRVDNWQELAGGNRANSGVTVLKECPGGSPNMQESPLHNKGEDL